MRRRWLRAGAISCCCILNPPPFSGIREAIRAQLRRHLHQIDARRSAATTALDLACFLALAPASLPSVLGRGGGLRAWRRRASNARWQDRARPAVSPPWRSQAPPLVQPAASNPHLSVRVHGECRLKSRAGCAWPGRAGKRRASERPGFRCGKLHARRMKVKLTHRP